MQPWCKRTKAHLTWTCFIAIQVIITAAAILIFTFCLHLTGLCLTWLRCCSCTKQTLLNSSLVQAPQPLWQATK